MRLFQPRASNLVGMLLLAAGLCSSAAAEVTHWRINEGGRSWQSEERSSTAINFPSPNVIQIAGFGPGENITQALTWADGIPRDGFDIQRPVARIWNNYPLKKTDIPMVDGDPETSTGNRF